MTKVYYVKPQGFKENLKVSACYIEYNSKFLFLKRALYSSQGGSWGVPAGKLEFAEDPLQAILRELNEEISVSFESQKLKKMGKLWIQIPNFTYGYYLFYTKIEKNIEISLNQEHTDYSWYSLEDTQNLNLVKGAKEAFAYLLRQLNQKIQ